jgi:hypothetical protein
MPSYNQTNLNYAAQNANAVQIMIGDVVLAYAQTTNHAVDLGAQQLYGIGSTNPQEIQQLRYSPSISVEFFELTAQGVALLGTGSLLAYTLANTQVDIYVIDGTTGQPSFTYVGCVANSFSENIATNAVVVDSVSFLAMDILNAAGASILASNSVYSIPSLIASAAGSTGLGNV